MGLAPAAPYEALRIHADGAEARRAVLDVIAGATRTLDVCTFILARDRLGDEIAAALRSEGRARRPRSPADRRHRRLARPAGSTSARCAAPASRWSTSCRRSARSCAAAPTCATTARWSSPTRSRLWCGGRNFAAEYFEGDPDRGGAVWHDLSFDLRGELAVRAAEQFEEDWNYATRRSSGAHLVPAPYRIVPPDASLAQLVPSGPEQVDDTVQALLLSGCFMAQRRILAVTPYFIPDATLLMALTLAARRGVQVDLILPRRSNHRLADVARHRPLRDLAAAGARLWFTPFMLHAKVVVIDEQLALAGSANLDLRSLFLNYELMVAFYEPADVGRFAAWIERERRAAVSLRAERAGAAARSVGRPAALAGVPALTERGAQRRASSDRRSRERQPSERSAAWTIASASTSKWRRSAARVSLRPKPSVPRVTQRRPGGRKARICSGTART